MTFAYGKNRVAVLPTYRRMCKFIILIHFLALTVLYKTNTCTFSVLMLLLENEHLAHKLYMHRNRKKLTAGKSLQANADFILNLGLCFSFVVFTTWLVLLLYSCGDVHPNPGPLSTSSTSSSYSSSSGMSNTIFSSLDLSHNLSFVHYNVQSVFFKIGIIRGRTYRIRYLSLHRNMAQPFH